ncbi:hypothetical protein HDU86_000253 [Geranomyces michiganensis]|nr:hypothetical protein HDU86_000253 [Geranomyces michiganensis]
MPLDTLKLPRAVVPDRGVGTFLVQDTCLENDIHVFCIQLHLGSASIDLDLDEDRGVKFLTNQLRFGTTEICDAVQAWFPNLNVIRRMVFAGSRPLTDPARQYIEGLASEIVFIDPLDFQKIWGEEVTAFGLEAGIKWLRVSQVPQKRKREA